MKVIEKYGLANRSTPFRTGIKLPMTRKLEISRLNFAVGAAWFRGGRWMNDHGRKDFRHWKQLVHGSELRGFPAGPGDGGHRHEPLGGSGWAGFWLHQALDYSRRGHR